MPPPFPAAILHGVFVLSGLSALIYQLVWQRALLMIYGSNVESVAMVVAAFLAGLGIGSLMGGWLSKWPKAPLVLLFGLAELGVGAYGLVSLKLFDAVGAMTSQADSLSTGLLAFSLVFLPTLLMGATLPLLVAHQVRVTTHVGRSVSQLYFVNTLGAALGAFIAARWLLGHFGMSATVHIAAALNASAAIIILATAFFRRSGQSAPAESETTTLPAKPAISFRTALVWSVLSGFITLSWEIVWSRIFNFASSSLAPAFGYLLASYLFGLALGSLASQRVLTDDPALLRQRLARWVLHSSLASFLIAPFTALCATYIGWWWGYGLVIVAGAMLGITFPLLCHAAVPANDHSGSKLSQLYLANIIGSGAGSLLTGFVFMEWLKLHQLGILIFTVSAVWSLAVAPGILPTRLHLIPLFIFAIDAAFFNDSFYERLQYKTDFTNDKAFTKTIESRHGVITVDAKGGVYGNGAYDGIIGTKLEPESWVVRPYFLSAVRDRIERVLVIGVASGSWTQILVNHPQVKSLTAIELSHGYLDLIRSRPEVASLLTNPKLHLVIDDGRRWLRQHPDERFDAIVMNTTYYWREFASALLSREFLTLVKSRLTPDGIAFWNCTGSDRAARTGMDVFPHTMMVMNHCLASNAPLIPDRARWQRILSAYQIEGRPLFDLTQPEAQTSLQGVLNFVQNEKLPQTGQWWNWCGRQAMQDSMSSFEAITDDNLGDEYRPW